MKYIRPPTRRSKLDKGNSRHLSDIIQSLGDSSQDLTKARKASESHQNEELENYLVEIKESPSLEDPL